MYIIKFLQWSLIFLVFVAFKQIDDNDENPAQSELVYMAHEEVSRPQ